jgi:hypothetical protein
LPAECTASLVGSFEDARAVAERGADRVVEPPAQHVVAARRACHGHDLPLDELVTLVRLVFEAQVLLEVDGPSRRVGAHG